MSFVQRTAWDAYLTVTRGLLPALHDPDTTDAAVNAQLGAVAKRILRYAPLWGEHGPMLLSALHSAVRLHRAGERGDLAVLARIIAHRLYALSAGPRRPWRETGGQGRGSHRGSLRNSRRPRP